MVTRGTHTKKDSQGRTAESVRKDFYVGENIFDCDFLSQHYLITVERVGGSGPLFQSSDGWAIYQTQLLQLSEECQR